MKYTIDQDMASLGRFAGAQFGMGVVTRFCSNTLRYISLYGYKDLERMYRQRVMLASVKETYVTHISDDVKSRNGKSYKAWIMSLPFNPIC